MKKIKNKVLISLGLIVFLTSCTIINDNIATGDNNIAFSFYSDLDITSDLINTMKLSKDAMYVSKSLSLQHSPYTLDGKSVLEVPLYYQDDILVPFYYETIKIRVYFAYNIDDEIPPDFKNGSRWLNLDDLCYYNEFVHRDYLTGINNRPIRIAFIAENPINNFRFLSLALNENWVSSTFDERRYFSTVEYEIDILNPNEPFVVTGVTMGSSGMSGEGFSFVDSKGITRYFEFHTSGYEGDGTNPVVRKF